MLIYITRFYDRGLIRKCKILLCKHKNCSDFLLCKEKKLKVGGFRIPLTASMKNLSILISQFSSLNFQFIRTFAAPFFPDSAQRTSAEGAGIVIMRSPLKLLS